MKKSKIINKKKYWFSSSHKTKQLANKRSKFLKKNLFLVRKVKTKSGYDLYVR